MRERKICIIGKCYESNTGGPSNIIRELVKNLQKENIKVETVLLDEKTSKVEFIKNIIKKCILTKGKVINVHTDGLVIPFMVYLLSKCIKKNSYYLTVHGIYSKEARINGNVQRKYIWMEKILYSHFDNIICVSKKLKTSILEMYGRKNNICVIPNATDAKSDMQPQYDDTKLKIISLGGLKLTKGIDYLLDLSQNLNKKEIRYELYIYGASEKREQWFKSEIEKRNLVNQVFYYGELKDKQRVYDLVAQMDIQLCMSRYDTFNVAIAESLVLGCPVIASDGCGASYLIEDDAGCVINLKEELENDFKKSCDYIKKIKMSKEKRKDIYVSRTKYQEKVSWQHIAKAYSLLE